MTRKAIILTVTATALLATGAIAATSIHKKADGSDGMTEDAMKTAEQKQPGRTNVETELATHSKLTEFVKVNGDAMALMDITYSAEIPGRLEYLGAKLGRIVNNGQVLAKVDFKTLRAQKNQAAAAYDLAKKTNDRLLALGSDLVTHQKLDEASTALENARAGLEIARDASQKSVVRSRIRGVVSEKFVEASEYVTPGMPLFRIVDHSTIIIDAQLPESQVSLVPKNAVVSVTFGAIGETLEGTVDAVLPTADPVSKTFTARIKVANPDLRILPGMSATVRIAARTFENVVVVPQDLIIENKSGKSVFVVDNGKAVQRIVTISGIEGDRVAIQSGVMPGDAIVRTGHRDLTNGQSVAAVQ